MFTMAKLRDGSTYLANHLSANDYYSEKEAVTGIWTGRGAELLGLAGRAIGAGDAAFERLRTNRHPLTGRKLTVRTGAGRIAFLDFQCSAPKSVSLLAVTFGDERLRQAHHDAVSVAFAELERFAARRVRGGTAAWSEQTAPTGILCAARFEHDASRALDAQLHTHLVTANATFDAAAQRWFALTEREMLSAIRYAGKVYQNELARRVLAAGFPIEQSRNERGVIEGFEIAGVTASDRAVASKRRAQIEKEISAFRQKHGREPTTREVHGITTRTRRGKLAEITTAEVRRRQRADFSTERAQALAGLVAAARLRGPVVPESFSARTALRQARDHLFERSSVERGHEILAEALNQNLGRASLEPLRQALAKGQAADCVVLKPAADCLHADYATQAGLMQELDAIVYVNCGRGTPRPLYAPQFQPDARLSPDQRKAVETLLESTDRVCALRGVAGTGKTFTLQEVQRGMRAAGRRVHACAPTTSAAAVLRAEGFAGATTLADVLKNGESPQNAHLCGATLIVDEAGMASMRQGAELCALAGRQNTRLLLVGDSRQHSGVEAGDFLSLLEKHSLLQTCELTDIRRQKAHEYRAAVKLMAQGQARAGVDAVDRLGWLHEAGGDYIQRAAAHYVSSVAAKRDAILVAPTWEEIHRLTEAVRADLKKRGMLGQGETVTVAEPLAWTKAQSAKSANYQAGYFLTLHRALPEAGLNAGDSVEVLAIKRRRLQVRDAQGQQRESSPRRHAAAWTVAAPRTIELAPGDRILIRQNHRAARLVNGEVLTLESRLPSGAWCTRDGAGGTKEIPADFRAFAHGYAMTSHKAQGRTCDEVIVCAAQLDAKSAYVAFSRARERAAGYTPDKTALFAALPEANRPRQSALDLWTPARRRRLRWVRTVLARVREIFGPAMPAAEPALPPVIVPLPPTRIRPARIKSAAEDVSAPSHRPQQPERHAVRIRF